MKNNKLQLWGFVALQVVAIVLLAVMAVQLFPAPTSLSGAAGGADSNDLNTQIDELQAQVDDLISEVETLNQKIDDLTVLVESLD